MTVLDLPGGVRWDLESSEHLIVSGPRSQRRRTVETVREAAAAAGALVMDASDIGPFITPLLRHPAAVVLVIAGASLAHRRRAAALAGSYDGVLLLMDQPADQLDPSIHLVPCDQALCVASDECGESGDRGSGLAVSKGEHIGSAAA